MTLLACVAQVLVVLDEAYIEFSGQPSRLGWPARHDNLIVLRTFSKSAGLAGDSVATQIDGQGCDCVVLTLALPTTLIIMACCSTMPGGTRCS